jgi:ATP-dependent exoDNAse (exonuclease V) beta subunit
MAEVLELEDLKQRRLERIHEEERIAWEKKYKYKYNTVNRCSRDNFISFDETNHTYTVDGKILQSVTNIVENCFPKFDAELHAKNTAAKMGITPEEVIAMWEKKGKESRELGTAMHQKIEKYYQGEDSYEDDAFKLFKVFAEKVQLVPYRTEWAVYDTDYNVAGTIDFVDCQDGKFTIYDWKRSDKIIANGMPVKVSKYQEKGLYPLEHLENCAYYHYALQLSLYKFILEKNYDIKVSDLRLGIFHPSYDKPYVLKMPYLENEVKTLMELRSEVIL